MMSGAKRNGAVERQPQDGPGRTVMPMPFIPAEQGFELLEKNEEEGAERERRGRRIHASRDTLSKETWWTSSTNTVSDGTYGHLLRAAKARAKQRAR